MESLFGALFLVLFPIRDAIGIYIASTPIRISEFWMVLSSLLMLPKRRWMISRNDAKIVGIMVLNLALVIIGCLLHSNTIESSFAIKYIIRQILYLLFVLGISLSEFTINKDFFERLFKYITLIQLCYYVITYITGGYLLMGKFIPNYSSITSNFVTIGSIRLLRFKGFCSESGYSAPFLVLPLYYYLNIFVESKKNEVGHSRVFLIILLSLSILTFSTAVYILVALTVLIVFFKRHKDGRVGKILFYIIIFVLAFFLLSVFIPSLDNFIQTFFIDKVLVYTSRGSGASYSFSGMDRSQHVSQAIRLFSSGSFLDIIFGRGTGAYYYYSSGISNLLQSDVSEAYNLYLSTLTDRGIVGLILLLLLFWTLRKYLIKNDVISETLYWGIISQGLHWFLTGNLWLYYFWYEVFFVICYFKTCQSADNSI